MIIILICVVISQVLLQKDELWIERNSSNDQISDGNYHIFRNYQIEGQVHNIQEYRDKFSYYLFILTSKDNYFSLIILQDPADDFRKQTIFRAQNQSCDHKFVITQFYILWKCHTTKDMFYLYNLQTKLYKVQKLMDVYDKYFIFDFNKLIRYSNNTLRLYTINDNQLSLSSQYDSNFTILDHFDNQKNALIISKQIIYVVWYIFEGSKQTNYLQLFQYYSDQDFITDEDLLYFDYFNGVHLIQYYLRNSQEGQSISWLNIYQSNKPVQISICQIYNRKDQRLLVYDLHKQVFTNNIQINDSAIPFINLQTNDLFLFHNLKLLILVEINYKSYYQPNYPASLTKSNIKEIKNSQYIYQNEKQFNFLHFSQKGYFSYPQIYFGGDVTYSYSQIDLFDILKITFKTIYFTETVQYQSTTKGNQIQNIYQPGFYICQQNNNSFTIQFIGLTYYYQEYYYDQIINSQDYLLYIQQIMFIAIQQEHVLYVYKLTMEEKIFMIKLNFDEIDFDQQYAFILLNGNVLKYDFFLNKTEILGNHLFGFKIYYENNFYAYKDSKLIIANYIKDIYVVYQNLNLNTQILRMYIFQYNIFIISQNQIQKFEKINSNRIILIGNIELYGNIINENSTFASNNNEFIFITNSKKLMIINSQLSLSQALVMSFEMEIEQQLLFTNNERLCFRVDKLITCQKLDPRVQFEIDFYSNEKFYKPKIQLESSNKYDTQRYNQVIDVFQVNIPMKIIHNKTVSMNSQIDLGNDWYQGSVIQIFSNNQEILKYIREKRYIFQIQNFINAQQQQGDHLILYSIRMLILYNIKNHTSKQIRYPDACFQALIFNQYILYSCQNQKILIFQCEQFQNCFLAKSIEINEPFVFQYDSFNQFIMIRFVTKRIMTAFNLVNLSLEQIFQYKIGLYSDYYYNGKLVVINFEDSCLTITNQEKDISFNETFKNFNQTSLESVQKIKILNENHFLVSFKHQGIFIYHFDNELSIRYNLFPHKILRRSATNVVNQGNDKFFSIQTEDNYVLIYKVVLDNNSFQDTQVIEPEIQLYLEDIFYLNNFQLFFYENFYYIVMQDNKMDSLIVLQINFNNILRIDNYTNKLKIRISDLEKFETMELTIYEEFNYFIILVYFLPMVYIVLRFKQFQKQK